MEYMFRISNDLALWMQGAGSWGGGGEGPLFAKAPQARLITDCLTAHFIIPRNNRPAGFRHTPAALSSDYKLLAAAAGL